MRIFIAALLPHEILTHIGSYQDSLKDRIHGVKWESRNKLHITLKFLGYIDESRLIEVNNAVAGAVSDRSRISLTITHFGAFPNLTRPQVLYAGFGACDAIVDLQNSIDTGLAEIGFEKDKRKFIPHVTIARVKSKVKITSPVPIIEKKDFQIEKIAVVRSFVDSKGSTYKNLSEYELI